MDFERNVSAAPVNDLIGYGVEMKYANQRLSPTEGRSTSTHRW